MDTWRNGCFGTMIFKFPPQQTTTLPKWMFSQKVFFNSPLLLTGVQHSSTSPKQQRRSVPSLQHKSFFYAYSLLEKLSNVWCWESTMGQIKQRPRLKQTFSFRISPNEFSLKWYFCPRCYLLFVSLNNSCASLKGQCHEIFPANFCFNKLNLSSKPLILL